MNTTARPPRVTRDPRVEYHEHDCVKSSPEHGLDVIHAFIICILQHTWGSKLEHYKCDGFTTSHFALNST